MTSKIPDTTEESHWHRLGDILEEFSQAWESSPPEPQIENYISHFPITIGEHLHIAALTELVKVDMEHRSKSNSEFYSTADYGERWPVLNKAGHFPPDLIYEEARLRKTTSDSTIAETIDYRSSDIGKIAKMIDPTFVQTTSMLTRLKTIKFEPGMTIDDFDLLAKLGSGSFATVFLARQNSMQRLVALKISADQGVEGQTLAQLDHPHIVRVYDQRVVGEPPVRLMYMQYIAGSSLKDVFKKMKAGGQARTGGQFIAALNSELDRTGEPAPVESRNRDWIAESPWHQVVSRIGSQLAGALAYSHSQGVLHRDIKPANVLVDLHGFPKLVDFNISFSSEVVGTTAETYFGGSLAYMSPEQLEASGAEFSRKPDSLDEKTDIFSLGVVLYELVTGDRPFKNEANDKSQQQLSLVERLVRQRQTQLDWTELNKNAGENELLVDAVVCALQPEPRSRFQSANSMERHLSWASDETTSNYLCQTKRGWRRIVGMWPFLSIVLVGAAISMFATWFVICFNAEEAIATEDQALFQWLRRMINRFVYPLVMALGYLMVRPLSRALKRCAGPDDISELGLISSNDLKSALHTNLNLGSRLALAFAIAWTVSGVSYPLFLTLFGASVGLSTWSDFVLSHVLAGLITAAYFFCTVSTFSLAVWHPILLRRSLRRELNVNLESELSKIQSHNRLFQVLAIATPLAAIAALVNLRTGLNTFAVGVLSTASFFGLGVLVWTSRQLEHSLNALRKM